MKALVVIDYTQDFVTGALPVGQPAVEIEETIAAITEAYCNNNDEVIMAVDLHEENDPYHPETALFPPHNIRGTEGRQLYGRLAEVMEKRKSEIQWMDKTRYSAFCGTDLELKLRARGITDIALIGVCTDICVLHTAVEAYNKGFHITIYEDAVASFNSAGHDWALGHFRSSLGAQVVKASETILA
ncbi:Peroxyureidoacrylate/ureidoacrylate amidohydrolase RutB [Paenibacillus sp. JJ-100]|uniref:cysteine hydrolase family protein n=1 Tax=Paenibacillus sp. JJ-100 TaxID=2974896 RepID=UPI0022FF6A0B|nr:isochorismatase family cysteine hydrolase [Paenibacillus sp. JJ-100]CAI6033868.1 Peroxyureidoacrylate/ureidoacrylate amidohydrolase RutB [Paenibacillus sp. JJ-100]